MFTSRVRPAGAARLLLAAVALGAFAAPAPAAGGSLRPELAELAKDIHQLLKGKKETAVAIGQFTGPPNFPTSAGPGIAQVLTEELQKLGVEVKARAKLGVKGEYSLAQADAPAARIAPVNKEPVKELVIKLRLTVVDALGSSLVDLPLERAIRDEADIIQLTGAPVVLPLKATNKPLPQERDEAMRQSITDPKPAVAGTRVAAGDKYAIEILVDGKPRPAEVKDDLAWVPISRGSTYAVRLINDSDLDAAVRLTIDGLSVFAFSEVRHTSGPKAGEPLYNVYLVPPRSSMLVPGWHVNNQRSDQFVVTEYARSASASLNNTTGIGTITATFSAAWEGDTPPPDEPGLRRNTGADATGRGQPVDNKLKEVVRTVGAVRASASVRYTRDPFAPPPGGTVR